MPTTYTVKEAARILGYSTNSIYTFLKEKRLKGIRLGKGRFRIPQSEMDRLLSLNSKASLSPAPRSDKSALLNQTSEQIEYSTLTDDLLDISKTNNNGVLNLFDWFLGMSSVVLGMSLFLFSKTMEEATLSGILSWQLPIRVALIAGGLGLVYTNISKAKNKTWHRIFHGILGVTFAFYSITFAVNADAGGIATYGILALVIVIDLIYPQINGVNSFKAFLWSFLFVVPTLRLAGFKGAIMPDWLNEIIKSKPYIWVVWLGLIGGLFVLHRLILKRFNRVQVMTYVVLGILFSLLSISFARNLVWGRAFFMAAAGLVALVVPVWDEIHLSQRRWKWGIIGVYGIVLMLFVILISVVSVLQRVLVEYSGGLLADKAAYGRIEVEHIVSDGQGLLERESKNAKLVMAVKERDLDAIQRFLRELYNPSGDLSRLGILDLDGNVMEFYPLDARLEGINLGEKDYFKAVVTTKEGYLSNVYSGKLGNPVVAMSYPIFSEEGELSAVLVGALDLQKVGDRLQRLANKENGEYFLVLDNNSNLVAHPDRELLSTPSGPIVSESDDESNVRGVDLGYTFEGKRMIQAYETLDKEGWVVSIQAPISSLIRLTQTASIAVVSVIGLSMLLILTFTISSKVASNRAPPE